MSMRFRYRAARADGTIDSGVVEANNHAAAAATLASQQSFPIDIKLDDSGEIERILSPSELALGLRLLATLLSSGLPISKALLAFSELAPGSWRPGLRMLQESVRQGRSFATSLEACGLGVPTLALGLIRAGEAAGQLAGSIRSAAEIAEHEASTRAALRNAVAYPLMLIAAALATVALLVGFVVPRFTAVIAETGGVLPRSTQLLIAVANVLRAGFLPAVFSVLLLLVLWRTWYRTPKGRLLWDHWMLLLPVFGSVRRATSTSRFCEALGVLLESGVSLASAIRSAGPASGSAYVEAQALVARERVLEGRSLSSALTAAGVFTPTSVLLLRAGEESGDVTTMLRHASRLEADRGEALAKQCLRFVEPTLVLFVGGLIACIAAALLQALYSARPA
jgi:general secretion pathway protein F